MPFDKPDKTEFFTVVGAPYLPERHDDDSRSHYLIDKDRPPPETGVAGLWAVFYIVIAGAWLIGGGTVGKAIGYAVAMLK